MDSSYQRFQTGLLPETLARAARIPFYANLWGDLANEIANIAPAELLSRLPSFDKGEYRASGVTVTSGGVAASLGHSTGTTGTPFLKYRSSEEREATHSFYSRRRHALLGEKPRLQFNCVADFVHGSPSRPLPGILEISVSAASRPAVDRLIDLLLRDDLWLGQGAHERVIIGAPDQLAIVTAELVHRFGTTAPARIDLVINITDALPRPQAEFLRRAWAPGRVLNRFSLSEVVGGASELSDGTLLFDPIVIAEVLEIDSDFTLSDGVGELTMTELYPFSEIQPLIRYRTGDVVRVSGGAAERPKMRLLGRRSLIPFVKAGDRSMPLIDLLTLRSMLEGEPGLARDNLGEHAPAANGVGNVLGALELTDGPLGRPVLRVILAPAFNPNLFPSEARDLADRVGVYVNRALLCARDSVDIEISLQVGANLPMFGSRPGIWDDQYDGSRSGLVLAVEEEQATPSR